MFTRVAADGVRLFATAIPLAILLKGAQLTSGWPQEMVYILSIVLMAFLTLIYTYSGGIRAVIWTDVIQMFVYILAAVAAAFILIGRIPGGFDGVLLNAAPGGKLEIFRIALQLLVNVSRM